MEGDRVPGYRVCGSDTVPERSTGKPARGGGFHHKQTEEGSM